MLINHRTAQLGVVNQKRPKYWVSKLPDTTYTDGATNTMALTEVSLLVAYKQALINETDTAATTLALGEMVLIDDLITANEFDGAVSTMEISELTLTGV